MWNIISVVFDTINVCNLHLFWSVLVYSADIWILRDLSLGQADINKVGDLVAQHTASLKHAFCCEYRCTLHPTSGSRGQSGHGPLHGFDPPDVSQKVWKIDGSA